MLATSEVIPSAHRLIQSMRDLGYDIATALSDLVDNSIAAGAQRVWIDTCFEGEDSWVRITDDGRGMTSKELREAMRFGTRRAYSDDDLGKFGLGLKSASLSQCRRLTVASRTSSLGRIAVAQWDLDHVEDTDKWEVLRPSPRDSPLASEPLRFRTGTVVLWDVLDRVVRYRFPDGRRAETDFSRLTEEIHAHLAMTFHRFLSGEAKLHRTIELHLNGMSVLPWDPFARDESATVALPPQRLRLNHDGRRHTVTVKPHLLPSEADFSTLGAHRRAAGPRHWTRQQGFYFYRNDRLIQAGGWSRIRTQDEHTKLARIAVDIASDADEAFELNVSKTQVRIPFAIRADLAAIASSVCRLAEEAYRRPRREESQLPEETADARLTAVTGIVRMVVAAAEGLIYDELSDSQPARQRLVSRLREMETAFAADISARLGLTSATVD